MIKILNNLPSFCENCPYLRTKVSEQLASGAVAFTCVNLVFCEGAVQQYKYSNKETDHEED